MRVAPCVRQRLLDDAVGGEIDARRQRHNLALQDEPDVRTCVARSVDELGKLFETRLGRTVGLASYVLAQNSQQTAGLGERIARGRRDRLESSTSVGRQLRRGQASGLALDGDHREVMRNDVVQLARNPRPLLHRGLLAHAFRHRLLRCVERGDYLRALASGLGEEYRGDHEQERPNARRTRLAAPAGSTA